MGQELWIWSPNWYCLAIRNNYSRKAFERSWKNHIYSDTREGRNQNLCIDIKLFDLGKFGDGTIITSFSCVEDRQNFSLHRLQVINCVSVALGKGIVTRTLILVFRAHVSRLHDCFAPAACRWKTSKSWSNSRAWLTHFRMVEQFMAAIYPKVILRSMQQNTSTGILVLITMLK